MKVCPNCQHELKDDNADKCIACSYEFEDALESPAKEAKPDAPRATADEGASGASRRDESVPDTPAIQHQSAAQPGVAPAEQLPPAAVSAEKKPVTQQLPPPPRDEAAAAALLTAGENQHDTHPPKLAILTPNLTFNVKRNKSGVQPLIIRNNGGGTLSGTIETFNSWLQVEPQKLIPQNKEQRFNVTVNASGLVPGEHTASIRLETDAGGDEAKVHVLVKEHWWVVHSEPLIGLVALILAISALPFATDIYYLFFNRPPIFKGNGIEVSNSTVNHGEKVKLTCRADDPNRDKLSIKWVPDEGVVDDKEAEETWLDTSTVDTRDGDKPVLIRLVVSDGHAEGEIQRERTILVRQKKNFEPVLPEVAALQPLSVATKPTAVPPFRLRPFQSSGTFMLRDKASSPPPLRKSDSGTTISPGIVSEPYRVAMSFYRERRYKEALETCERGLKLWPNDLDLQALRSKILAYLKEIETPVASSPTANGPRNDPPPEKSDSPVGQEQTTRPQNLQGAQLIHKEELKVPPIAQANNIYGVVEVKILIDAQGNVISARAVKGNPILRQAAEEAMRKRRYKPALRDGHPVASEATVRVTFKPPP